MISHEKRMLVISINEILNLYSNDGKVGRGSQYLFTLGIIPGPEYPLAKDTMRYLFIDLKGPVLLSKEHDLLRHPAVAGVVMFSRNCKNEEQFKVLCDEVKVINPFLKIAIDQEGGRVQRIKSPLTVIPAMRQFGHLYDQDAAKAISLVQDCAWLVGSELKALGVDINFAPVVDIDQGVSSIIGSRAFHSDTNAIVQLSQAYIEGLHEAGVLAVAKHYPGHGSVKLDSHIDQPVDLRNEQEVSQSDLRIYGALTRECQSPFAIMASHVIYPNIDDQPASFSDVWLKQVLRDRIDFKGLVFTDCLTMKAAHIAGTPEQRIVQAMASGCDLMLLCNHQGDLSQVLEQLPEVAQDAPLDRIEFGSGIFFETLVSSPRYQKIKQAIQSLGEENVST